MEWTSRGPIDSLLAKLTDNLQDSTKIPVSFLCDLLWTCHHASLCYLIFMCCGSCALCSYCFPVHHLQLPHADTAISDDLTFSASPVTFSRSALLLAATAHFIFSVASPDLLLNWQTLHLHKLAIIQNYGQHSCFILQGVWSMFHLVQPLLHLLIYYMMQLFGIFQLALLGSRSCPDKCTTCHLLWYAYLLPALLP